MFLKVLKVTDTVGTSRVSRQDGERLRREVERLWPSGETIEIDFENVRIASVSFLDEGIAVLALRFSLDDIKRRLRVVNMTAFDRRLLNELLLARARERKARLEAGGPNPTSDRV